MKFTERKTPAIITNFMIAPCGMNCALCSGYLREKNICPGCNSDGDYKPKYCFTCRIKTCENIASGKMKYCFKCEKFPCTRLKQLDKRYRTRYGMSMLENLEYIREAGIRRFVRQERERWTCPDCGGIICVHREECIYCGRKKGVPS
jgi:hypothetical protein